MGEPTAVWEERINALAPYQVNAALMAKAKRTAVFMPVSYTHLDVYKRQGYSYWISSEKAVIVEIDGEYWQFTAN